MKMLNSKNLAINTSKMQHFIQCVIGMTIEFWSSTQNMKQKHVTTSSLILLKVILSMKGKITNESISWLIEPPSI